MNKMQFTREEPRSLPTHANSLFFRGLSWFEDAEWGVCACVFPRCKLYRMRDVAHLAQTNTEDSRDK
ncbi:MAG: hypothetical protein K0R34_4356 [Herbinix sp.]|nr:hypothetical protein [Herbinix sp.]